jgi:CMP-N,N'-diacetyllegionaminic acid synthase
LIFIKDKKKIIAIIPARSGSKKLRDKNIRELNGKPLMAYTIEAAVKSGVFSEIIVSTDSPEYVKIARQYGAYIPFLRPDNLSTDAASSSDVIVHAIEEMQKQGMVYECFMLLQPTSPLRTPEDIVGAINLFENKKANSVVGVCEMDHSPLWSNTLDATLSMDNFLSDAGNKMRQDLPTYYRINGALYLSRVEYFLKHRTFYKEKSFAFIMARDHSIDIDDLIDFILAELLLQSGSVENHE